MRKIDYSQITSSVLDEYVRKFDIKTMQPVWTRLRQELVKKSSSSCANLIYPDEIETILRGSYASLCTIYEDYMSVADSLSFTLVDELKDLFNYSGRPTRYCKVMQPKIADFFMENAEKMEIHVCFYCETSYVNVYAMKSATGKSINRNHFDLDHFLPKSECPIVGLSFYNFVPSCSVCNEKLKRNKLIGGLGNLHASPTSGTYEFDKDVKIKFTENGNELLEHINHPEKVKISFLPEKNIYADEIRELRYEDRYNYHKMEAIRLFNIVGDYPDSMLEDIATLFGSRKTKDEVENDILYGGHKSDQYPRVFDKLRRDIINQRKGKI